MHLRSNLCVLVVVCGSFLVSISTCEGQDMSEFFTKNAEFGHFDRELEEADLQFVRNEPDGDYQVFHLKRPFVFVDPGKRKFIATPGVDINGASIPEIFRSTVGQPWDWDQGYVPAAVVHDVYCTGDDRYLYSCWRVHRMFYDACRANGTDKTLARTMWAAILLGGPKWLTVQEVREEEYELPVGDAWEMRTSQVIVSKVVDQTPPAERLKGEGKLDAETRRLLELMDRSGDNEAAIEAYVQSLMSEAPAAPAGAYAPEPPEAPPAPE